jgi:putative acetyltransferase
VIVVPAHAPPLLADARRLIESYADALGIDLSFQGFREEMAALPGDYAPPRGCLLLAQRAGDGEALGVVGVRPLEPTICELKRMFVQPAARGLGVGRALAEHAIAAARAAGYARLRLDTLADMHAALAVYRALGFVDIPAYRFNPLPNAVYLELGL